MKFSLIPFLFILLLLPGRALAQQTTPHPPVDTVTKTECASTYAYPTLEELKAAVLLKAKQTAVNELYGELITGLTEVENFVVTRDQIRALSSGFVRVRGSENYHNGANLGEVCVTIDAYTTAEDRAKFQPQAVSKRLCVTEPNRTVAQIRSSSEERVLILALHEHDRRLADVDQATLLRLLRQVQYTESNFLPGTESFCVAAQAYILPVEVMALLAIPTATPTRKSAPTATPTPRPTITPTPRPTLTRIATATSTPYGLSKTVTVSSLQDWQDSGLTVQISDGVEVRYISGKWSINPPWGYVGPEGHTYAPHPPNPIPDAQPGELIGRIGNSLFRIGPQVQFISQDQGHLYLRMNDDNLADNGGSLNVQVIIRKY